MTDSVLNADTVCSLSGNWWAFVLRAVVALITAVLAWHMPAEAIFTLTIVFGAFALADGVFGLISAVRNIRKSECWVWLAVSGVLGILTGLVVLVAPLVATLVLAVFLWASIAFWSVFSGMFEIAAAIRLRKEIEGEIWLGPSGALSGAAGRRGRVVPDGSSRREPACTGLAPGASRRIFSVATNLLGLRLRGKGAKEGDALTA